MGNTESSPSSSSHSHPSNTARTSSIQSAPLDQQISDDSLESSISGGIMSTTTLPEGASTISESPSAATLSTGTSSSEEELSNEHNNNNSYSNDYYHDDNCQDEDTEETLVCSSLFSRKTHALLLSSSSSSLAHTTALSTTSGSSEPRVSSRAKDGCSSNAVETTRQTSMKRSISSLCYPSLASNRNDSSMSRQSSSSCSPYSSLPRSSSWTSSSDDYYSYTLEELHMHNGDLPTAASDLRPFVSADGGCRNFWVVTTAALPWMTGTAVNPLLRAAHLSKLNRPLSNNASTVTLVIPWLESPNERVQLYGKEWFSKSQADQDAYIRTWLSERAGLPLEANVDTGGIDIVFYPARLHQGMHSIFAMGDICSMIPSDKADVCFLEEPEHLNWYRAPRKDWWTAKFTHVVGVGHTNYKAYVPPLVFPPIVGTISSLMVRAYCHKLIKLSPVLQTYAPEKEVVANVHGIRSEFLQDTHADKDGIYFIGKLVWAKGFDKLIELQTHYRKVYGSYFEIDVIGSGPEEEEIQRAFQGRTARENSLNGGSTSTMTGRTADFPKSRYEFRKDSIPANFVGRRDHASCRAYKIFVNPSLSEVLCTTTAEAIAMGKFVLVPVHPSNLFFAQFPNCLQYHSKKEFVTLLQYAMTHDPEPLTAELRYELTWEAATERCLEAAAITRRDAARRERIGNTKLDHKIAKLHYELGKGKKGDVIRKFLGGGPVSDQVHYEMTVKEVALNEVSTECA